MAVDLRGRDKPYVVKAGMGWRATVIRGYSGNYETDEFYCPTWREAFDWAYRQVEKWRP